MLTASVPRGLPQIYSFRAETDLEGFGFLTTLISNVREVLTLKLSVFIVHALPSLEGLNELRCFFLELSFLTENADGLQ